MTMKNQRNGSTFKAVIFDLDGTLLYTLTDIARAINSVLSSHGYPTHAVERYRSIVGWGLFETMRHAMPEEHRSDDDVAPLAKALTEEYQRNPVVYTVPYSGIATLLDSLSDMGITLAILSNKEHSVAEKVVAKTLSKWNFAVVQGNSPELPSKPDPAGALMIAHELGLEAGEVLYVGDSGVDMETAVRAGMFPAGVLWGYKTKEEIEGAGAGMLFSEPEELLSLFPPL